MEGGPSRLRERDRKGGDWTDHAGSTLGHNEQSIQKPDAGSSSITHSQQEDESSSQENSHSASMFTNAHHVKISESQFNIYQMPPPTSAIPNQPMSYEAERPRRLDKCIKLLQSNVAAGASYDSAERSDVPKCHPETREAIITQIKRWARDPHHCQHFLWMYGPAGCGKTTIMETVAELFDKEGALAASFFFSRSGGNRPREKTLFVTTIAAQLCLSTPGIRDYVAMAIDRDPGLFSKNISRQMERLVIEPFTAISARTASGAEGEVHPVVIVVDGLDECNGASSQVEILELLATVARESGLPFRFLVASRPEHAIRAQFSSTFMNRATFGMPLDNDYKSYEDIRVYLESRFSDIKTKHPAGASLPPDWPTEDHLVYMVNKSSGQFIYASVVMDWIESAHHFPVARLQEVLNLAPLASATDMPFAQLDALYAHILFQLHPDNLGKVLSIMSWMILDTIPHLEHRAVIKTLALGDTFFGYHPGQCRTILTGLSALVDLDATHDKLRFFHASFPDFLLDRSRSDKFAIDPPSAHTYLARQWIRYSSEHASTRGFHRILKAASVTDAFGVSVAHVTRSIFFHCGRASLTTELHDDLHSLDLQPTLAIISHDSGFMPNEWWPQVFLILNFIIWLENQTSLNPEKLLYNHFLNQVKITLQKHWSEYPPLVRDFLPVAWTLPQDLSFPKSFKPAGYSTFRIAREALGPSASDPEGFDYDVLDISSTFDKLSMLLDEECFPGAAALFPRSKTLLVQILADFTFPTRISGVGVEDGRHYAALARVLAERYISKSLGHAKYRGLFVAPLLGVVLSKASVDISLAAYLRENALQFDMNVWDMPYAYDPTRDEVELVERFTMASLVYVKECGLSFREHTHPPGFVSPPWICAICKAEGWEVDLSEDPTPEAAVAIRDPGIIPDYVLVRFAPFALGIQVWVQWLVELMRRILVMH